MKLQLIQDHEGSPGVFIPIKDWEKVLLFYPELENLAKFNLSAEQIEILDSQEGIDFDSLENVEDVLNEFVQAYEL